METKKRITKEEVEKYTEKFKMYVNMYESILERGGVNSEQFFTLIEIYDRVKNNDFYAYRKIDGRDHKIRIKRVK